ncbi:phosphoglycerate kinase [Candidatus Woesearchaeota archaeon]|nr:phosphoglycerate kinase [Candidatus Woesearchaeota archaeon]
MRSLQSLDVRNKRVLLRAGFDVPLKNNRVVDDARIREALPTINYLLEHNATVIIITHLGRPEGKVVPALSAKPVGKVLARLLKRKVVTLDDCIGVEEYLAGAKPGEVYLLENLRFHPEEKANDAAFARKLAGLADVYVNDAFSDAHRSHASIVSVPKYLPHAVGLFMEKEVNTLSQLLSCPKSPYVAVLGGAKISDKIELIKKLLRKADIVLTGGAMALSFYKSIGVCVGNSKAELYDGAKKLLSSKKIVLPVDFVGVRNSRLERYDFNSIPKEAVCYDNGPETTKIYQEIISKARTLVWNGPMGFFEDKRFAKSTVEVAKAISLNNGLTIVGGGDTVGSIEGLNLKYSHVSTGGGAMLTFLEGKMLPGVRALK